MKKLFAIFFLTLMVTCLLSLTSLGAIVEFEDDYLGEDEIVFAAINGAKPFIADSVNPEPLEDACYWLADNATNYNIRYLSFLGDMSSRANFLYKDIVTNGGGTQSDLRDANASDTEWIKDFELLKSTAAIASEGGIPYGISIGLYDYYADGFSRDNHIQSVFAFSDFLGETGYKYEAYDNNNFVVFITVGKTMYSIYQLEAFPRKNTLAWFNTTIANNSDKRAIIFTTSFVEKSGEMYTQYDWDLPDYLSNYGKYSSKIRTNMLNSNAPHDGTELWADAFSLHDNILLVVSANDTPGTDIVTSTFTNPNGYPVVSVLANLDTGYGATGKAYPVLIKLSADNKTIDVRYAVPYYNKVGGYVKESHKVINLNKVVSLPEPDPVTLLTKVEPQSNDMNVAYINGYENNLFKPNNNMTKAEACTIFARLLTQTQDIPDGYVTRFTDVKEGDWYYNAIAYLDDTGYFYTTEGNTYNPNDKITRAEFVELAYFASDLEANTSMTFTDVEESSRYYNAIMAAAASGLVNGYGDGSFKPNATITRAEVVTVINRLLSLTANSKTVAKDYLDKKFTDISGHWAEYQILLASNDNVHGESFYNVSKDTLKEDSKSIYFENDHVKVVIAKKNGLVSEIINKATGENVVASSTTPWFTYLLNNSNAAVSPKTLSIEDGRLKVQYKNNVTLYFGVDIAPDFFTVTLCTNLPTSVTGVVLCQLNVNSFWELDNPDAFGISGVPMTTTVDNFYYPGGVDKIAKGATYSFLPVPTVGSKLGVVFSSMTEHREHLKKLVDVINPEEGLTSTHGGPYTYEHSDVYGDYVILQKDLTVETAEQTANLCKEYSIEQLDIHKGGNTFLTGSFNFVCARSTTEKQLNKYIDAATFKKRIGNTLIEAGIQMSLHTYSSVVDPNSPTLLTNKQYRDDIVKSADTWTVRGKVSKARTNIKTYEDASNFKVGTDGDVPYGTYPGSKYILIEDEIIKVQQGTSSGFLNVKRGQCGTTAVEHADGAKIYQLCGWYNGFQPKPLSSLFYKVAELTAQAYNDGGFEMIYLDGLESFARDFFTEKGERYYVYAEFVRAIVSQCENKPLIEFSSMQPCLWAARGRGGAIDHARRAYKKNMYLHLTNQNKYHNYFYTATAGWFNYCPDKDEQYKDTGVRTLYRDDLDFIGSLCTGYNFGTVCQPFSVAAFAEKTKLADNFMYYGLYTRLREGNYFAPEVRKQLVNSEYEHKVFKQEDGSWAFKEMFYVKHKIYDLTVPSFTNASVENPFDAQTPFIRIEQRYSTEGKEEDAVLVYDFDESKPVSSLKGEHKFSQVNAKGKIAFKLKVHGNGSETDALLISLAGVGSIENGRYDYFVPLNFNGWKEIILIEANNEDFDGFDFSGNGITFGGTAYNSSYRPKLNYETINSVRVSLCGPCSNVMIDTLKAYTPFYDATKNPSITIGDNTITFDAELHAGDYIEYYPEFNKAYLNYYTQIYNADGSWKDDEAHTKEINFTGKLTAPKGKFSFRYTAEALTEATTRAQVVFGFSGKVIANPEDWVAPEIDLPKDIDKPALY